MQKINLLGMTLEDYSLRESVDILEKFLHNGALNTILYISAKMLVGASISAEQKQWIENIDMVRWSDAEILEQAGITGRNRVHEVETQEFFKEFLKKVGRGRFTIYLLTETEEDKKILKEDLLHQRPDLKIVGEQAYESYQQDTAALINEMNSVAPKVIISRMSFDKQERLMVEARNFLNAEVWLALNYQMIVNEERPAKLKKFLNKWYHHSLFKLINRYEHHNDGLDSAEGS